MMFLKQSSLLALAACLGLGLVGCQPSDPNKPNVADVDSIAVTPNPVSLEIGGVQALTVTGSFSNDTSFVVTFDSEFTIVESSVPGVVEVDAATGYVTARNNGSATIRATHTPSGKTATTTVTVAPLRVLSIAVSPAATTLAPGATQALTVIATYNNLSTRPVTAGSTFVSSNPTVATVDATGVVAAVAVGTANITATHTASGNTAEAAITVAEIISSDFETITFDEAGVVYLLRGFGGVANPGELVADPAGGTNTVARVVKSATAELWAGTTVSTGPNESVGRIPFTATATRMSVRVYSPKPNIPVRLKLEDAADPTRSVETEARTTAAINTWQTLTFDFANQVSGTGALNLTYTYNKVSIFFDFGTSGPAGGDGTYHFDDVTFVGEGGASGSTGTCVAPSCTDFSAPGIGFAPFLNDGGGTVALALDPNDAANDVVQFVKRPGDGEYFGTVITGLGGPVVLTATSRTVTMRVYSPAVGTNFLLKFEGGTGGPATTEMDAATTRARQWETLTFVMPDAGTYTTVVIFPNGRSTVTADTTMYIDELSFPSDGGGSGSGSTGTCTDAACVERTGRRATQLNATSSK